jgi:hypothetical protein
MLGEGGLHPEKSQPKYLLLALYFLKVYPREGPGCSGVGRSKGAVDPKTLQKWVWLFLERITEHADKVVSIFAKSPPCEICPLLFHALHRANTVSTD